MQVTQISRLDLPAVSRVVVAKPASHFIDHACRARNQSLGSPAFEVRKRQPAGETIRPDSGQKTATGCPPDRAGGHPKIPVFAIGYAPLARIPVITSRRLKTHILLKKIRQTGQ